MKDNPVQFAVVREDPLVEAELIAATGAEQMLLVGSGGCTALTLAARFPKLAITVVDPNTAQLELIRQKMAMLAQHSAATRKRAFNIGADAADGLNACGNFESLFRSFRRFLNEFVLADAEMADLCRGVFSPDELQSRLFSNKYWSVAFALHFNPALLEAMFGSAAIQHAPPGSYPHYFQRAFEAALLAPAMAKNYFLHHILLGCYRDELDCLPHYLIAEVPRYRFSFVAGTADQVQGWEKFDLVDLSNIFDWMAETEVATLAQTLRREMRVGARLIFRQLNHTKDFSPFFGAKFGFDEGLGQHLLAQDRSFFYTKLNIATKL